MLFVGMRNDTEGHKIIDIINFVNDDFKNIHELEDAVMGLQEQSEDMYHIINNKQFTLMNKNNDIKQIDALRLCSLLSEIPSLEVNGLINASLLSVISQMQRYLLQFFDIDSELNYYGEHYIINPEFVLYKVLVDNKDKIKVIYDEEKDKYDVIIEGVKDIHDVNFVNNVNFEINVTKKDKKDK